MGKIHEALQKASPSAAIKENEFDGVKTKTPMVSEDQNTSSGSLGVNSKPRSYQSSTTKDEQPVPQLATPPLTSWDERIRLAIEPSLTISESFRKLRNKILHPDSGEPPRTILITSAVPEEGKGFAAVNLAIAIAHGMEKSCLVMGCDLRRPTLAGLFGYSADQRGISQYLNGEEDNWRGLVLPTALAKLSVIASGAIPPNPAELIDSSRMHDLLAQIAAEQEDRLILIDSPPLQAASETTILAQLVDKVVLVVRWGAAGREQVQNMIATIGREKIIGVIFNAFEVNALDTALRKKGYYGYYGYYGKNY